MKINFLLRLFTICFYFSVSAQDNMGIKLNGNYSNRWSNSADQTDYFFKPGFGVGVYYFHVLNNPKFALSCDLDYSYFRFAQRINGFSSIYHTTRSAGLFQFPFDFNVLVKRLSFSGGIKLIFGYGVGGGISYSEYFDGTVSETIYDDLWQYSKFDCGFTFGLKFNVFEKLKIGLNIYQSVLDNGRKYNGKFYWTRFEFGVYFDVFQLKES